MEVVLAEPRPVDGHAHDHVVQFYGDAEQELVPVVAAFLGEALESGDAAVVVATAAHRQALTRALAERVDVGAAGDAGRFVVADAEETLASILVDGAPERGRFLEVVGGLVTAAAEGGRGVRVFGEMVGLLWDRGDVPSAIALEDLWNHLRRLQPFSLFCGYSLHSLVTEGDLASFAHVCRQHTRVVPAATAGAPLDPSPGEPSFERSLLLAPTRPAPAAARQFVDETLCSWRLDALSADAQLVVSELATNSVVHGRSPVLVSLSLGERAVRIAVTDSSGALPEMRVASLEATSGRGVIVVDGLARRWGYRRVGGGKVVWADLDLPA